MKKYFYYLLIITLITFGIFIFKSNNDVIPTYKTHYSDLELENTLIIALFYPYINQDIQNFYSKYFTTELEVFNYEITIEEISNNPPSYITITFGVTPQIGAHNPVGYDELTYQVDNMGNITLLDFSHKKSESIPPQFKKEIKERLP